MGLKDFSVLFWHIFQFQVPLFSSSSTHSTYTAVPFCLIQTRFAYGTERLFSLVLGIYFGLKSYCSASVVPAALTQRFTCPIRPRFAHVSQPLGFWLLLAAHSVFKWQKPAKNQLEKKIVKLADHTCAQNDLTKFEYEAPTVGFQNIEIAKKVFLTFDHIFHVYLMRGF